MHALYGLFPLILAGCTGASDKVENDTGAVESPSGEGADDERWWEEGDEEEEEFDGEWERVDGYSIVTTDMVMGSGEEVWIFVENIEESFSKDGHEEDDSSTASCVIDVEGESPVCLEYIGFGWHASEDLDPEAHCESVGDGSDFSWNYVEEACAEEPKAVCMLNEGAPSMVKGHYYDPISLDDAEELCGEQEGDFYPLVEEEEDFGTGEGEYELGTRFIGYIFMDDAWGFASFEHFEESGENCRATAEVYDISTEAPCDDCEFAKSFILGEFEYEIDEGGCPRDELGDAAGASVAFGFGSQVIFEDEDGLEFHTLWFGEPGR